MGNEQTAAEIFAQIQETVEAQKAEINKKIEERSNSIASNPSTEGN